MKAGETKDTKKTETLNIRLTSEAKKVLLLMAEGTQAKTITSVIEGFVEKYKAGDLKPKDFEIMSVKK